ncbi:MAG: hypothetical protein KGJ45_01700 [Elusimicrobia bacterium]|nr:hypothetical protein [Elusimicrobiota bacterium]MDE2236776.1 hypothetical protein [Elusimicrobiota bacterium]
MPSELPGLTSDETIATHNVRVPIIAAVMEQSLGAAASIRVHNAHERSAAPAETALGPQDTPSQAGDFLSATIKILLKPDPEAPIEQRVQRLNKIWDEKAIAPLDMIQVEYGLLGPERHEAVTKAALQAQLKARRHVQAELRAGQRIAGLAAVKLPPAKGMFVPVENGRVRVEREFAFRVAAKRAAPAEQGQQAAQPRQAAQDPNLHREMLNDTLGILTRLFARTSFRNLDGFVRRIASTPFLTKNGLADELTRRLTQARERGEVPNYLGAYNSKALDPTVVPMIDPLIRAIAHFREVCPGKKEFIADLDRLMTKLKDSIDAERVDQIVADAMQVRYSISRGLFFKTIERTPAAPKR